MLDSKSASSGQLNIAMYIRELCDQGLEFDEICEKAAAYRDRMNTYFVLESLDTLKKNGRLTGLQAFFATKLNINRSWVRTTARSSSWTRPGGSRRPCSVWRRSREGSWDHKRQASGDSAHCNAPERAQFMKEKLCSMAEFKEVVITDTCGVSTVYASDGGVILAL